MKNQRSKPVSSPGQRRIFVAAETRNDPIDVDKLVDALLEIVLTDAQEQESQEDDQAA